MNPLILTCYGRAAPLAAAADLLLQYHPSATLQRPALPPAPALGQTAGEAAAQLGVRPSSSAEHCSTPQAPYVCGPGAGVVLLHLPRLCHLLPVTPVTVAAPQQVTPGAAGAPGEGGAPGAGVAGAGSSQPPPFMDPGLAAGLMALGSQLTQSYPPAAPAAPAGGGHRLLLPHNAQQLLLRQQQLLQRGLKREPPGLLAMGMTDVARGRWVQMADAWADPVATGDVPASDVGDAVAGLGAADLQPGGQQQQQQQVVRGRDGEQPRQLQAGAGAPVRSKKRIRVSVPAQQVRPLGLMHAAGGSGPVSSVLGEPRGSQAAGAHAAWPGGPSDLLGRVYQEPDVSRGLLLATQQSQGPAQPPSQRSGVVPQQLRRGGSKRGGGRSRPAMEGF